MSGTLDSSSRWEHFPHGADVGVRGIGPTPAAAFEQAAVALTAAISDPDGIAASAVVQVECDGPELDELFFNWIDTLVFEMSTRKMVFGRFRVEIDGTRLRAQLWGERVDREKHRPDIEIKGPTYTELTVRHDAAHEEWIAQCVVDV